MFDIEMCQVHCSTKGLWIENVAASNQLVKFIESLPKCHLWSIPSTCMLSVVMYTKTLPVVTSLVWSLLKCSALSMSLIFEHPVYVICD